MTAARRKSKPARAPLPAWRKVLYGLLPTLVLVLALLGVEGVLRAAGRGISTQPFATAPGDATLQRDNLDFPFKYHPVSRHSRQDVYRNLFRTAKAPDALRGVVLGGSTAEGFPYGAGHAFSGLLQEALTRASGRPVEVLNLGFSAMSSYYVRDAARKLAALQDELQLDFVVIYTGHNEYYGTISYASGSSHLAKLVNMRLKDYRLFQLIYNALAPGGDEGGPTLMTRQYDQTRFPPDAARDAAVLARFLENVGRAADALTRRGIAVALVEPVCNLVDMPPFVAADEPGLGADELALGRRVVQGDADAMVAWLADADLTARAAGDPLAAYVTARARMAADGGGADAAAAQLADLVRAKDLDPAPFRARSNLVAGLADWARGDDDVLWIPLGERLLAERGAQAFGNELFIDHLHFTHAGQVAAAKVIAEVMAAGMPRLQADVAAVETYFADPDEVDASVDFVRVFDVLASRRVADLVAGPPYSGMALPYATPGSYRGEDGAVLTDPELRGRLRQAPEGDVLAVYSAYLLRTGRREAFLHFLDAFRRVNPGSPATHMAAGNFFATLRTPAGDQAALDSYRLALVLSADEGRQLGTIRSYLTGQGRADLAARVTP